MARLTPDGDEASARAEFDGRLEPDERLLTAQWMRRHGVRTPVAVTDRRVLVDTEDGPLEIALDRVDSIRAERRSRAAGAGWLTLGAVAAVIAVPIAAWADGVLPPLERWMVMLGVGLLVLCAALTVGAVRDIRTRREVVADIVLVVRDGEEEAWVAGDDAGRTLFEALRSTPAGRGVFGPWDRLA